MIRFNICAIIHESKFYHSGSYAPRFMGEFFIALTTPIKEEYKVNN